MLVVKIEIWPYGDEKAKREIANAKIWNTGTGTIEKGNYDSIFISDLHGEFRANLKNHDRSLNVWKLVQKLISKGVGK